MLITEFICGGGLANHPLDTTLKQEGQMMLQALLDNCRAIDDCEIVLTLDSRVTVDSADCEVVKIEEAADYFQRVLELAATVDYVWVVAPESDDVLLSLMRRLERQNIKTINCDSHSIDVCADKKRCNDYLSKAGLQAVPNLSIANLNAYFQAVVVKPRYGVGCENIQIFSSGWSAQNFIDNEEHWIAQPLVQGEHCSLSLLCCAGEARILTCNAQQLSNMSKPDLTQCKVNAFVPTEEMQQLATKLAQALPGLYGYVGVDFIQTKQQPILVEVNPRLTTSYIGLCQVLNENPAQLCIEACAAQRLPASIQRNQKTIEINLH